MPVAVPLLPGDYIRKMTEAVYSVSEINNFIKHILEQEPELRNLQVVGEISNFKRYPSGHCYFTLKDAGAVLKCVMFRSKAVYRFTAAAGRGRFDAGLRKAQAEAGACRPVCA